MLRILTAAALVASAVLVPTAQATPDWHVGTPPLTTPWTDDVSPANALPEYPRPQLTRPEWRNLNGLWEWAPAAVGEQPPFGRTLDEKVLVPYPIESALSGLQKHEDRMWYRRTFQVPDNWKGKRLVLHFGAVDYDAKVWVNGRQVATHRGGYDGFDVDVTNALHTKGPQELIVWAEDLTDETYQPIGKQREVGDHGIFYQGSSGIWRTVWMEPVNVASISRLQLTPDLPNQTLKVTAETSGPAEPRRRGHGVRRTPAGRPGERQGGRRTPAEDPEPEDLVARQSVPVRPQGQAVRPRQNGRPNRLVRRDALGRTAERGRRQASDGAEREDPVQPVHPRPGLLAGRTEHGADRRGAPLRPRSAQDASASTPSASTSRSSPTAGTTGPTNSA